ncbi:hypothetical protein [Agromyces bauzanensis]|uniref:Dockerin domain-containing protein n=1 Tax=Agromyces bauzanensis TaxID=1308924 RepID=A0A917P9R4_9MICO|nr:hypothetical protein [Agromyces bauzanensis]GGJ67690.1 hypothetical protein GCM10011372_01830 [Agromyces bauzanensis]
MNTTITRLAIAAGVLVAGAIATTIPASAIGGAAADTGNPNDSPVHVDVLAPSRGDHAGLDGAGWFVDLSLEYHDGLAAAGFSALQLTGPAAHNDIDPFPGTFSTGADDRLPGLVVLTSTTSSTRPGFSGPGTNLANLFNLTGITDRSEGAAEIWDAWLVGAPIAGEDVDTVLTVAVIDDLDGNGVFDDAPAVVPDANQDGAVDKHDLQQIGVASNIVTVPFRLNGDSA